MDKKKTTLTTPELSYIKRTLFDMIKDSGKIEEPGYDDLAEALGGLSFKNYSPDAYASQLSVIIEDMIDLDDLAFEMGQVYHFKQKLT
jgi:hypothetical protein